ncbi:MAG: DUF2442 domain-containing protein [Bacteroidota bacterium]|nr:DUF2442 domain-containing protein [Bacteroidota bacterium]
MVNELLFTAKRAWHENGMICILLSDNREVRFPIYLNEKLRNASFEQISNIEIMSGGTGLNWPDLDEDLSVIGILEGRFGKK